MTATAGQHLLFGLLALQNGLINQNQLLAAFQAWTLEKSNSLADYLEARGDLSGPKRLLLEGLAAVHLEAHDNDLEKSLAAASAGKSTRERLARLGDPAIDATLGHLNSGNGDTEDGDADRTSTYAVGTDLSNGQRFRIVRPHAQGGLGAVFVALDGELNREVALKQILEKHADDPDSRRRFVAEAEITGALEHPGVVPVYGLGTDAHGRPYYAMRFIKGDSLKEAIARFHDDPVLQADPGRRSLELRKLLRRFTDVCNAVDYAHSRGVIHRDVKPANIILGKHGETLVVDWGLAKSVGRTDRSAGERTIAPSSSGSFETLPGSALGTPAYMSPEQVRGELDRLGPQSDVYNLGATLYCLLSGKPPFAGEDIGVVLQAVQEGRYHRPSHHDPALDKALEAVCLKAMSMQPEHRYPTPKALADDLDRWMADEPVSAWREPLSRRARRWAKQNRTTVATAAVTLLAGVVGLSAVLVVQTNAKADIARALGREKESNVALAAANDDLSRSRAAVQARYDLAVEAIKTFHTGVSEDFLLKQVQFNELRDRLLKSAADFYGKLAALLGKETDFTSRRALAQSNFELADLTGKVGRNEDALAAHRAVLAARQALAAEPGAETEAKVDVGRSLTAVADLLQAAGKMDEALAGYRQSESLLARPAGVDRSARAALAACRSGLGLLLTMTGKRADALATFQLARSDYEALAAGPGASNDARRDLAATINRIGAVLWYMGKPASEMEAEFRTAIAIQQKLVDDNPTVTEFRNRVAMSHNNLGLALEDAGKLAEAEAEYRDAIAIYQKVSDDNPAVTEFRRFLAVGQNNFGILLSKVGKLAEAEEVNRKALAIWQTLADDNPEVTDYRAGIGSAQTILGDVVRLLGRVAEARDCYERAIALEERVVQENPTTTNPHFNLAYSLRRRGLTRRKLGEPAGAAADARRALGLLNGLPPQRGEEWFETACCHAALAGLAGSAGSGVSAAESESEANQAMALLWKAVGADHRDPAAIGSEWALDALRSRSDFRMLMMDLAFPTEPFRVP
jgi:eukaryotic-like serine/threonine-protein kinase